MTAAATAIADITERRRAIPVDACALALLAGVGVYKWARVERGQRTPSERELAAVRATLADLERASARARTRARALLSAG